MPVTYRKDRVSLCVERGTFFEISIQGLVVTFLGECFLSAQTVW